MQPESRSAATTEAREWPYAVYEALRLAERIEQKYPVALLRDEAQDALVQLARIVREELA